MNEWQTKFQKGSEEWLFFQEMYGTLQSFWKIENVTKEKWDQYWKELKEQVEHIRAKYNNSPLARNFTDAILYTMVDKSVGTEHECKVVLDVKLVDE